MYKRDFMFFLVEVSLDNIEVYPWFSDEQAIRPTQCLVL